MTHPPEQVKDAAYVMHEKGKDTDAQILGFLRDNPNSTVSQIAEYLGMTNGRVDNGIKRLQGRGLVKVQYYRRNRGLVKKIRSANEPETPFDILYFPLEFLNSRRWEKKAYFCALSRSAIKISPVKECLDNCLLVEESPIERVKGQVKIRIPEQFVNFYELPNSEMELSGRGDELLLTINSTLVPLDVPDNYISIR
jgi:DNA-binding Lrp family transcriptional regulator